MLQCLAAAFARAAVATTLGLGRLKMREWKNRQQIAGVENAGVD